MDINWNVVIVSFDTDTVYQRLMPIVWILFYFLFLFYFILFFFGGGLTAL